MDKFTSKSSLSFYKWVFTRNDNYDQIVFYFLSSRNATSPRYYPLFNASEKVRIVVLSGLKVPYTDKLMLKIFWHLVRLFRKKASKYKVVHTFSTDIKFTSLLLVLHIDDPEYSKEEIHRLMIWESNTISQKSKPVIVTTNEYTRNWLDEFLLHTKKIIIEQGFYPSNNKSLELKTKTAFACAYSSQYIHYNGDKHGNHLAWNADILIDSIIPRLEKFYPRIEIHLIGELGKKAQEALMPRKNIVYHGKLSQQDNANLLARCDLGLYPRKFDNRRSMSKIFSYLGAGLPVVGFDLVDTSVIKNNELGVLVSADQDFINAVYDLSKDFQKYSKLRSNVTRFRVEFNWRALAHKMESQLS